MACLFWGALLVLLSGNLGGLGYTTIEETFNVFDLISRLELFNQLPNYLGYFLLWLGFRRFSALSQNKVRQVGLLCFAVIAPIQQYMEYYSFVGAAPFILTILNLTGQVFALYNLGLLAETMHREAGEPLSRRRTVTVSAVFLTLSLPGLVWAAEVIDGVRGNAAFALLGPLSSICRFARFLFAIWILYGLHRTMVLYDRSLVRRGSAGAVQK